MPVRRPPSIDFAASSSSSAKPRAQGNLIQRKGQDMRTMKFHLERLFAGAPKNATQTIETYYKSIYAAINPKKSKLTPRDHKTRLTAMGALHKNLFGKMEELVLLEGEEDGKETMSCNLTMLTLDSSRSASIISKLGQGGLGEVHRLHIDGCVVAGKFGLHGGDIMQARLLDEALAHAALTSPLVLEALEATARKLRVEPWSGSPIVELVGIARLSENRGPLIVMRSLDISLADALQMDDFSGDDLLDVLLQVLSQLHVLVKTIGFTHRDLRPENIMLTRRPASAELAHRAGAKGPSAVIKSRWRPFLIDMDSACADLSTCSHCAFSARLSGRADASAQKTLAPYCLNTSFDVVSLIGSLAEGLPSRLLEKDARIKQLFDSRLSLVFEQAIGRKMSAGVFFDSIDRFLGMRTASEWTALALHQYIQSFLRVFGDPAAEKVVATARAGGLERYERLEKIGKQLVADLIFEKKVSNKVLGAVAQNNLSSLNNLSSELKTLDASISKGMAAYQTENRKQSSGMGELSTLLNGAVAYWYESDPKVYRKVRSLNKQRSRTRTVLKSKFEQREEMLRKTKVAVASVMSPL